MIPAVTYAKSLIITMHKCIRSTTRSRTKSKSILRASLPKKPRCVQPVSFAILRSSALALTERSATRRRSRT